MSRYAIPINEDTLDLIQVLNGGVRPLIEEKPTFFLFETDETTNTKNPEIRDGGELYTMKEEGHVGNGYVIRIVK